MNRLIPCLVLFVAACGSNPSIDDFYSQQIAAQCEFAVKCCATVAGAVTYTSVADCEAQNMNTTAIAQVKAEIKAGTLTYDSGAAGSCIDGAKALYASCSNTASFAKLVSLSASCEKAIQGTAKVGASCDPSNDANMCQADAYCNPTADTTGTCTKFVAQGGDCTNGSCTDSDYCDGTTMKCTALKSGGTACGDASECQSFSCDSTTMTCDPETPEPVTVTCQMAQSS